MTSTERFEPARGGRFGSATPGAKPPPPTLESLLTVPEPKGWLRRRRRAWIVLAIGLVAVAAIGVVAGHYTWRTPPPKTSELAVTTTALAAGTRLAAADLRVVTVSGTARPPAGAVRAARADGLIGLVTSRSVPAGAFLQRSWLTPSGALPGPGQAVVGLALKPGQLPAGGLVPGQQVLIVLLRASAQGSAVIPQPLAFTSVWSVSAPDTSGDVEASVLVAGRQAATLAAFAAQQDVVLVSTGPPAAAPPTPSPAVPSTPPPAHQKPKARKSR
jgi:hypothetical protein